MAIKFEQVSFAYRGMDGSLFEALKDINLEIAEQNEFIALIGETGSGKSTLVQHMNALVTPEKGTVTIYGIKINQETKKKKKNKLNPLRKKVGLVFQFPEYQLFEETVERDIMFGPKNFGVPEVEAKLKASEVIKLVGLNESYLTRSPFNLSGGEKKRVSIAGILAMEPDILVLDEPTSGLDPKGRDDLLTLFKELHQTHNKTVILITHDMNIVYEYANRVLVMNKGNLVYDGDVLNLFTKNKIEEWNLDLPDLIELKHNLEQMLNIKLPQNPSDLDELYTMIKEVI